MSELCHVYHTIDRKIYYEIIKKRVALPLVFL